MKKPWLKFFPADWLNDIKLKNCTLEEKGFLIDLICLLHQCEPYGYLPKEFEDNLHKMLSLQHLQAKSLVSNLVGKGVVTRCVTSGLLYNKRMVQDDKKHKQFSEYGKIGIQQKQENVRLKPPLKPRLKPSLTIASDYSNEYINKELNNINKVIEFFENNFGLLTQYTCDELKFLEETHGEDNLLKALKIAVEAGKRNLRYVKGILDNEKENDYKWEKLVKEPAEEGFYKGLTVGQKRELNMMIKRYEENLGEYPKEANIKIMLNKITNGENK